MRYSPGQKVGVRCLDGQWAKGEILNPNVPHRPRWLKVRLVLASGGHEDTMVVNDKRYVQPTDW